MKGIKMNGVTLYLGNVPGRKSLTFFYHEDGDDEGDSILHIAGYVPGRQRSEVERVWKKMTGEE